MTQPETPRSRNASSSRRFGLGEQVGPYRLTGVLGQGGMGAVFRAKDPRFDRDVAIKVILAEKVSEKARARFQREANAMAMLKHPAITQIHDMGEDQGRLYLVQELVPGGRGLEEVVPELERIEILELLLEVARGLGHAHAHGIVHRDVKPSNILVSDGLRPFLTDFGLVTGEHFANLTQLTQSGSMVGTPSYMAPEQFSGHRERIGPATDVWALGVVLYEALTGELPFRGDSLAELFRTISLAEYVPLRKADPTISPALAAVVEGALQAEPDRRFSNGEALAAALEPALRDPASRGAGPLGAAAAIAVLLVVLAGAFALRARSSSSGPPTTPTPAPSDATAPKDAAKDAARPVDPNDVQGLVDEAARLQELGDLTQATGMLTRALDLLPNDASLWVQRSLYQLEAERFELARKDADRAVTLDPKSTDAWRAYGLAQMWTGDIAGALVSSQLAIDTAKDSVDAWILRAEVLRLTKKPAEARAANEQALAIDPDSTEALNNLSILHIEAGEFDRAERGLRRVTELEPTKSMPWLNLAAVYARQNDLAFAREILSRGIKAAPHSTLYETRGDLREKGGDPEGALEDYAEALKLAPDDVRVLTVRARLLLKRGEFARAAGDVSRAIDAKPTTHTEWDELFTLARGVNDTPLSKRALEGMLELNDKNPNSWNTLAVIREREGDTKGAFEAYDRAIALNGDDAATRFNRGELHYRRGNFSEALHDLRRAERTLEPNQATVLAKTKGMIAEIEAKLGR